MLKARTRSLGPLFSFTARGKTMQDRFVDGDRLSPANSKHKLTTMTMMDDNSSETTDAARETMMQKSEPPLSSYEQPQQKDDMRKKTLPIEAGVSTDLTAETMPVSVVTEESILLSKSEKEQDDDEKKDDIKPQEATQEPQKEVSSNNTNTNTNTNTATMHRRARSQPQSAIEMSLLFQEISSLEATPSNMQTDLPQQQQQQQSGEPQTASAFLAPPPQGDEEHNQRRRTVGDLARSFSSRLSIRMVPPHERNAISSSELAKAVETTRHESSLELLRAEQARRRVQKTFEQSRFSGELGPSFPRFSRQEIRMGKYLGRGAYSMVEDIEGIDLETAEMVESKFSSKTPESNNAQSLASSRKFIANHCLRESGYTRYAIKYIRPEICNDQKKFWTATVDMLVESRFLKSMEHPHVIKLRGISAGDPYDATTNNNNSYFLVLDRLYETLAKRIRLWGHEQESLKKWHNRCTRTGREMWRDCLAERISRLYDLSAAFAYLHKRRLCHRDIKPENVGFDVRGDIKVFDLGLARELPDQNDVFNLTSMTGSLRYMAPEVALGHKYNESCDVYSFSVLMWEMLTCCRPFTQFSKNEESFTTAVYTKNHRPRVWKRLWSSRIQYLIRNGWSRNIADRPSMSDMEAILSEELLQLRNANSLESMNKARRRSTSVYSIKSKEATNDSTEGRKNSKKDLNNPNLRPESSEKFKSIEHSAMLVAGEDASDGCLSDADRLD